MTIEEKTALIAFGIILLFCVIYQFKLYTDTKASINDLRNTVDTLYKTSVENEEDKCKIYKRLANLEETENNG